MSKKKAIQSIAAEIELLETKDLLEVIEAIQGVVVEEIVDLEDMFDDSPFKTAKDRDARVDMKKKMKDLEKAEQHLEKAFCIIEKVIKK